MGVEHDELGVKATTAVLVQTTKLFWPFSSSPSKKAAAIGVKASKSHSLQPHASLSAESDERINNSKLESKAIREAQEVMRELVLKDRQAAHKAAEENVRNLHTTIGFGRLARAHSFLSISRIWLRNTSRKQKQQRRQRSPPPKLQFSEPNLLQRQKFPWLRQLQSGNRNRTCSACSCVVTSPTRRQSLESSVRFIYTPLLLPLPRH